MRVELPPRRKPPVLAMRVTLMFSGNKSLLETH